MSTYNYVVITKKDCCVSELNNKLTQHTSKEDPSCSCIPERIIQTASINLSLNNRLGVYELSASEATELLKDPHVLSVEILPQLGTNNQPKDTSKEQSGSLSITTGLIYSTSSVFTANYINGNVLADGYTGSYDLSSLVNAGLLLTQKRNTEGVIVPDFVNQNVTNNTDYNYTLDGSGVDIIISDPGCNIDHADFKDVNGNSRFIELNWNTALGLTSNETHFSTSWYSAGGYHGTYMASVCAGTVSGIAKGADLYFIRTALSNEGVYSGASSNTWAAGIPMSYDLARLFHMSKSIDPSTGYKKPTLFVQSIGAQWQQTLAETQENDGYTHIVSKSISGVVTTAPTSPANLSIDTYNVGMIRSDKKHPARQSILDIAAEEMCDAGVIFCGSGGNVNTPMFESGSSQDKDFDPFNVGWYNSTYWDNSYAYDVEVSGIPAHTPIYYMRGSSPLTNKMIKVGALSMNGFYNSSSFNIAPYSNKGPRIDVVAPTQVITAGYSSGGERWVSPYFNATHTPNSYDRQLGYGTSGTSFAGPMTAGVVALYLQLNPQATSLDIKRWLRNNASILTGSIDLSFTANAVPASGEEVPPLFGTPTQSVLYNPFNSPTVGKVEGTFNGNIIGLNNT